MFDSIHFINLQIMAEVLAANYLFGHYLMKKEHYAARLFFGSITSMLTAFLFPISAALYSHTLSYGSVMYGALFLISLLGLFVCYQEDIWSLLFVGIAGYTLHQLASALRDFFQLLLPECSSFLLYAATLLFSYTICYFVFAPVIRRHHRIHVDNKKMLLLTAAVLFIDVEAGLVSLHFSQSNPQPAYQLWLQLYNALSCIFILCIQFGLLANRSLELELKVVSQMLSEEQKQYQMSKDTIELINLKCHDLKYQIRQLRKRDGEVDKEALKNIEEAVGIYDSVVRTGCSALDTILTEKSLVCEKAGISITCMADGERLSFMAPADIYSLFGNALDNAIEAVLSLPDVQRNISLNISAKGGMVSIHVENYCRGLLRFEDGLPCTDKDDRGYHGFGMKSMRSIAEKYDGFLTAAVRGNVFHLNIAIPHAPE